MKLAFRESCLFLLPLFLLFCSVVGVVLSSDSTSAAGIKVALTKGGRAGTFGSDSEGHNNSSYYYVDGKLAMCYHAELAGRGGWLDAYKWEGGMVMGPNHWPRPSNAEMLEVTKSILLVALGYAPGYSIRTSGLSYSGDIYALYHSILSVWVVGKLGANEDGAVGWRDGGRGHSDWDSWHSASYNARIESIYTEATYIRDFVKTNYPSLLEQYDVWRIPDEDGYQGIMFLREAPATPVTTTETVNFTPKVEPYALINGDSTLWLTTYEASVAEAKRDLPGFYENADTRYKGYTDLDLNDVYPNAGNSITVGMIFDKTYSPAAKVNYSLPMFYASNSSNTIDGKTVSASTQAVKVVVNGSYTYTYYLPTVSVTLNRGETKVVCEVGGITPSAHTYTTTDGKTTLKSVDNTTKSATGCMTLRFTNPEKTYNFTSTSTVSGAENTVTTGSVTLNFSHNISPNNLGSNNAKYSSVKTYVNGTEVSSVAASGTSATGSYTVSAPNNKSGSVTVKQCAFFSPTSVTINPNTNALVSSNGVTSSSCATRTVVFKIPETTYHIYSTDTATIDGRSYTNNTYHESSYDKNKTVTVSFAHALHCENDGRCLPHTSYTTRVTAIDNKTTSSISLNVDSDTNSISVSVPTPGRKTVVCETVGFKPTEITLNDLGTLISTNNKTGTGTVCVTIEGPDSIDTFIPDSRLGN